MKRCLECGIHFEPMLTAQSKMTCNNVCAERRERTRQRIKNHGLTIGAYDRLWESQHGRCAICGKAEEPGERRLAIDHDHSCCPGKRSCGKCVRGLLCSNCNTGIGSLGDSPRTLRKAIDYLETRGLRETGLERLMEAAWGTAWVGSGDSVRGGIIIPGSDRP